MWDTIFPYLLSGVSVGVVPGVSVDALPGLSADSAADPDEDVAVEDTAGFTDDADVAAEDAETVSSAKTDAGAADAASMAAKKTAAARVRCVFTSVLLSESLSTLMS